MKKISMRRSIFGLLLTTFCLLFTVSFAFAFDITLNPKDVNMKLGATATTIILSGAATNQEAWRAWYDGTDDIIKKIYARMSFGSLLNSPPVKFPATAADDATIGTVAWTNPTFVYIQDLSSATVSLGFNAASHYLKVTNFGFAIPSYATIQGIGINLNATASISASQVTVTARLVDGGVISGAGSSVVLGYASTLGDAYTLWGIAWTPAKVNSSTFGAVISVQSSYNGTQTISVDAVNIAIYYTVPVSWKWQMRNRTPGAAWVDLHTAISDNWGFVNATRQTDIIYETSGLHIPFDVRLIYTKASTETAQFTFLPTGNNMELIGGIE